MTPRLRVLRVIGIHTASVGEPREGIRAEGRPPGGACVRRAVWALGAAVAGSRPGTVAELLGVARVRAEGGRVPLALWTPTGVRARVVAEGEEVELRGDPVLYWTVGEIEETRSPPPGPVDVLAGPDLDVLPGDTLRRLVEAPWTISAASDRMATRLSGPALRVPPGGRLPTAPMTRGAVEVPPDGLPLVFGPDHPVTGGYPLVAVLPPYAADDLACVPIGAPARFRLVDRATALDRHRAWLDRRRPAAPA